MSREIGSLRALSNGESQYVGSSSGVYFINTVRRAFSTATAAATSDPGQLSSGQAPPTRQVRDEDLGNPSPEDCIVGGDEQGALANNADGLNTSDSHAYEAAHPQNHDSPWDTGLDELKVLPDYTVARQLVMSYFRIWHPLVPFLNGPVCLAELDALYAGNGPPKPPTLGQAVIFRCIFNIAILDRQDLPSLGPAAISSPTQILPAVSLLALKCDISSVQALLSAQLYFVATMSLRNASTVGGLVSKSIVQSGLHRCPHRYGHLSPDDRLMRKRVFWSAYVLDRFLSQSLGHPNGIQDSDTDVCPPGGRDLHEPVAHSAMSPSSPAGDDAILHLPVNHPERRAASPRLQGQNKEASGCEDDTNTGDSDSDDPVASRPAPAATPQGNGSITGQTRISQHRRQVQAVLGSHVRYSQLIGRMLEIFHKSIHVRAADGRAVLFLKAEVGAWGNNLVQPTLDASLSQREATPLGPDPAVFPYISYQYSLLLVNRPSLSLDPDSAEFHSAIQVCIGAGTTIIQTMERHSELGYPLFWPGFMSAVWMSGLVLAFAAQLRMHSSEKAISGISSALRLLTSMARRWRMARHCKSVLLTLLTSLKARATSRKRSRRISELPVAGMPAACSTPTPTSRVANGDSEEKPRSSKRRSIGPRRSERFPTSHLKSNSRDHPARINSAIYQPNTPPVAPHLGRDLAYDFSQTDLTMGLDFPGSWGGSSQSANKPGNPLISSYHPAAGFYNHNHTDQLDFSFGATRPDPNHASLPYQRQFGMPIPTTFPDRRGSRESPNAALRDGPIFDVFDGATWGSLLDLVDDPTNEALI